MGRLILTILGVVALLAAGALADHILLKDGTSIDGTVVRMGDQYWVKTPDGNSRTISVADVASVVGPATQPAATLPSPPATRAGAGAGFIGLVCKDFQQELLTPRHGARVTFVYPNSPASHAGIRLDDVIVRWFDQEINGTADLKRLLEANPPGRSSTMGVARKFGDVYQFDQKGVVIADRSDFTVNIPRGTPPEVRQIIVDGELARQVDLETTDQEILKATADGKTSRVMALRERRAELLKAKGTYLPPLVPMVGSIGVLTDNDGHALTGRVLQVVNDHEAILLVDDFGIVSLERTDLSGIVDDSDVSLEGLWKIPKTRTYSTSRVVAPLHRATNTVYVLEAYSLADAAKSGQGKPTDPVLPIPKGLDGGDNVTIIGNGSGFFISDDGLIITNRHVVKDAKTIELWYPDHKTPIEVVAIDNEQDLALVRLKTRDKTPFLRLAKTDVPQDGADCIVMGYPLAELIGNSIKITRGIVSSTRSGVDPDADVMVDAKVNPGNSGGPMLDRFGNVMALTTLKVGAVDSPDTYGVGISAGHIRKFLAKNKIVLAPGDAVEPAASVEDIVAKAKPSVVCIQVSE